MYSETALSVEVDPVTGVNPIEYAQLERDRSQDGSETYPEEIAIIGFWDLQNTGVFRCQHSFVIPDPIKREVAETESTNLFQVLFEGDNGDIFFFYTRSASLTENELRLAVLDTKK